MPLVTSPQVSWWEQPVVRQSGEAEAEGAGAEEAELEALDGVSLLPDDAEAEAEAVGEAEAEALAEPVGPADEDGTADGSGKAQMNPALGSEGSPLTQLRYQPKLPLRR